MCLFVCVCVDEDKVVSWCVCNFCSADESKQSIMVCCGEPPARCQAIVNGGDITGEVEGLDDDDLVYHSILFTRTGVPESIDACTPAQKRLICYKKIFMILHGVGTTGVHVQVALPSCVRFLIDVMYPDDGWDV